MVPLFSNLSCYWPNATNARSLGTESPKAAKDARADKPKWSLAKQGPNPNPHGLLPEKHLAHSLLSS